MRFALNARRLFAVAMVSGFVLLMAASGQAQVVIGDFENGSVDGWQPAPNQSGNPMLSSVLGSTTTPPSNTRGDSALQVTINSGGFWGPNSQNLVSTPALRNAFINASSISYDMTIIGSQLAGGSGFSGFAQSNEMAINGSTGLFTQHAFSTTAGDTDSLNQNAGWNGMDGTRTITYKLSNFMVTDPSTNTKVTYPQYVANHPELTDLRIWFVTQFGNGDAAPTGNFYIDNVVLNEVPEPASMGLLGIGAAALLLRRRTRSC